MTGAAGSAVFQGTASAAAVTGQWANVTPSNASLTTPMGCGNYGAGSVQVDPSNPSNFYARFDCQGTWKSTDYGQTWSGPVDATTGSGTAADCAGGFVLAGNGPGVAPTIYQSCIRGSTGFWRSSDGGVHWTQYSIGPAGNRQDVYPAVVDPYDNKHLLVTWHELTGAFESTDGGQTWTQLPMNSGMNTGGGTAFMFFINTGDPTTTRKTWLWTAQAESTGVGTWRTADGGASWTQVDKNEHEHGGMEIYQPDTHGSVFMAGIYSTLGWGVLHSADYGLTWTHVGPNTNENIVFGTPNSIYADRGIGGIGPNLETAPPPGLSGYTQPSDPIPVSAVTSAVTYNGTNYVIVTTNATAGLWRFVEPAPGGSATPSLATATASASTATTVPMAPLAAPPSAAVSSGGPATSGTSVAGLHVQGNQILNASNQVVHLRGADKAGTEYMCLGAGANVFDGPADQASIDTMKAWQINIVRLPINEDCWLGINNEPASMTASAYQTAMVNYVNLLTANNIAVIFDLQWAAGGTNVPDFNLQPMPDLDHAPAFWTSAANTLKNNRSVIFDLFNEPFPGGDDTPSWTCLRDGGNACTNYINGFRVGTAVGMQTLVNTIRATGATNVIMSPGLGFTDVLTQWLAFKPNDPTGNLVASWHSYAGQTCSNQTCWDTTIKPILQSVPLIAAEIGENDCQDVYLNQEMNFLDANGGNYLAWAWNTYDCSGFPSLISAYDGTPTSFGVGYRNHLLGLAGQPTPTPVAIPMFSNTYPFGINVGSTQSYTASDGTVYYPDVAGTAMTLDSQFFTPYTTTNSIGATADPALYQKGRVGAYGTWTINVPNDTYEVTLGVAPTGPYTATPAAGNYNAGEWGQDQNIQGQKVGTCVFSSFSGTNVGPDQMACPQVAQPAPLINQANTITYTVAVYNQQLKIQPAASFGGGRSTILNMIRIARASGSNTPTSTPTSVASPTPINTPTRVPTSLPTATPTQPVQAPTVSVPAPQPGGPGQWTSVAPAGLTGFTNVVSDPSRPGTLYSSTSHGIYKSTDAATTWIKIDTGAGSNLVDSGPINALAIDPFNTQTLYAASGLGGVGGPLKSTDGGVSWAHLLPGSNAVERQIGTNSVYNIAIDPYTDNHLLASFQYWWSTTGDSGLLESFDGGATWTVHNPPIGGKWGATNSVWFLDNSQTWLVGSKAAGLWRTTTSGQSWTQVNINGLADGGVNALYRNANTGVLFIAVWDGILRSTDNGATWQPFQKGLPYAPFNAVIGDGVKVYSAPGYPFTGDNAQAHGPWLTAPEDGTSDWSAYNTQTPCSNNICNGPAQMAYDSAAHLVFAADRDAGLFRLVLSGSAPAPAGAIATPTTVPTNTPTARPTNTPTALPTNTPTALPTNTPAAVPTNTPIAVATNAAAPAASYASSAGVNQSNVSLGNLVTINASLASAPTSTVLIDVQVSDPTGKVVYEKYWDNQTLTNGQPRAYSTSWTVPGTASRGTYTVKLSLYQPGGRTNLYYSQPHATAFNVS